MATDVSALLGGVPYHVGIVVEDVAAGMEEYGRLFGVEWATRNQAEFPVVLGEETRTLQFDSVYSRTGPVRIEVTVQKPNSIWTASSGIHHIGFWSDDVAGESRRLEEAGYPIEALLFPRPGQTVASVAFCRGPRGLFVELVSSEMRAPMEASWD